MTIKPLGGTGNTGEETQATAVLSDSPLRKMVIKSESADEEMSRTDGFEGTAIPRTTKLVDTDRMSDSLMERAQKITVQ
ncbi:hypothetical protein EXE48_12200 [Halorubrum sp. ASP1]|uniref:hypothetical protein n=1 Tax=Halorubrum sp. ASP1 TaxID=2518114 RepID=UPI0010F86667|nr:hypothetical protein [Halorubrum sp. ASP1]TKX60726.1 hypothetical protein EXE48_12200 [Halorubrum sp. ASP1]